MHNCAQANGAALEGALPPLPSPGDNFPAYVRVLKEAWVYHVVAFLGFGTTLVVFPAVAVLAEPSSESWYDIAWNTHVFCLHNGNVFNPHNCHFCC